MGGGHTFRTRFSTSHTSMGYRVEDMDFMTDTEEIKDMDLRTGTDRKETLGFTSTETIQAYRDGEVGGSGILYLTPTRYTVTTRMILHESGQLCEPF